MDTTGLVVPAGILERFQEVFRRMHPMEQPLKDPGLTLTRTLTNAMILGVDDSRRTSFHFEQSCLFTVRETESGKELMWVASARGVRHAKCKLPRTARLVAKKKILPPKSDAEVEVLAGSTRVTLTKVHFSEDMLAFFADMFPDLVKDDPEWSARQVFAMASEKDAIEPEEATLRENGHEGTKTRYFRAGNCRFIVEENSPDDFLVVGIENVDR